jgi:GTP pyrophosphokinase
MYKSGDESFSDVQQKTHQWLQSLLELQEESGDAVEFLEHIKVDLFPDQVYVFTPKGKILNLPQGATCVDFAYAVHTEVGHHCIGGRVNGRLVPLESRLENGDVVDVLTSKSENAGPSRDWMAFVKSPRAKNKIRQWFKKEKKEERSKPNERFNTRDVTAEAESTESNDPNNSL